MTVSSRTGGAIIAVFGLVLSAVYVGNIVRLLDDPALAVVNGLFPLLVSGAVVVAGVRMARGSTVPDRFASGVLLRFGIGALGLGATTALWLFEKLLADGTLPPDAGLTLLNAVGFGALVGYLVGVYDVRQRRQQLRLDQLNRINNTLRIATREVVNAEDRSDLERRVCERLQQSDPYESAWIGRYDPETEVVTPDEWAGLPDDYYESVVIRVSPEDPQGQGPGGEAIRTGEIQCVQDITTEPSLDPWSNLFDEHGVDSLAVIPIVHGDAVFGILSVYADRPYVFDEAERRVLTELGETIGHAITSLDAREQLRRRERELANQNQHLEEFASVVSHDLRNPLNVAEGYLSMAREERDDENLVRVRDALSRMDELIDDVLTLARTGRVVDEFADVELEAAAEEAWRTTGTASATLEIESSLGTIAGDESRIRELFENLFRNAVEHSSTSSRTESGDAVEGVTVTVGALADRQGFYVADDGPGIPEAEREQVFEAGYSTNADGTGFGLKIVRNIAEAHGWAVSVTESESGGARFEFAGVSSEPHDTVAERGVPSA